MGKGLTYKDSGVDIAKANVFVDSIKTLSKKTMSKSVMNRLSGFGSLFGLEKKYKKPVLVSSTDGVGTKLLIAKLANKHDTVGIDLVGMNVNDVLCMGAKPLFFLDYIACGKIQLKVMQDVIRGIVEGCRQADCALIGGETAEMPGLYKTDEYDLAGFTVGVVEENKIIDGSAIQVGDVVIGLASNGIHSNGYSLVRKVFSSSEQKKFAQELLKPTRIYVQSVLKIISRFEIKGIAHITGGAFYEKLTKIIPEGKSCLIHRGRWHVPDIFHLIQKKGHVSDRQMFTTFNMGIGMVLVVRKKDANAVIKNLASLKVPAWEIGEIVKNDQLKISFNIVC